MKRLSWPDSPIAIACVLFAVAFAVAFAVMSTFPEKKKAVENEKLMGNFVSISERIIEFDEIEFDESTNGRYHIAISPSSIFVLDTRTGEVFRLSKKASE